MKPVEFYKCLADETRLTCLLLVQGAGELCVCDLAVAINVSQPKVSRHLARLRECGLLLSERRGQWVFYQINTALPEWMLQTLHITGQGNARFLESPLQRLSISNCGE